MFPYPQNHFRNDSFRADAAYSTMQLIIIGITQHGDAVQLLQSRVSTWICARHRCYSWCTIPHVQLSCGLTASYSYIPSSISLLSFECSLPRYSSVWSCFVARETNMQPNAGNPFSPTSNQHSPHTVRHWHLRPIIDCNGSEYCNLFSKYTP